MAKISPQLKAYIIGSLFPDRALANEYYDRLENLCTQYYPVSEALQDYIANYFFPGKKHLSQQLLRIVNNYPYCTPPVMNDELTYALRSQIKGDMELGWEYRRVFDQVCDVCYGYAVEMSLEVAGGLKFQDILINGVSYSLGGLQVGGDLFHFALEQLIADQVEIATGVRPTDVQLYNENGQFIIVMGGAPMAVYQFTVSGSVVGVLDMTQTSCPVANYCPVSCVTPQGILGIQDPSVDGDGYYLTANNNTYQMYVSGSPVGPEITCDSLYSNFYYIEGGVAYYGPFYFDHFQDMWIPLIRIIGINYNPGSSVNFTVQAAFSTLAGNTFTFQYSTDFGQTWIDGDTYTALQVDDGVTVDITEPSYRWRLLMSTPHTCEFYSATVTSSEYGFYYAEITDAIPGLGLDGYTLNGLSLSDPNTSAIAGVMKSRNAAAIGGYINNVDTAMIWFAGTIDEQATITVIDRDLNPVVLTWLQFTPAIIQTTHFTPSDVYDSGPTYFTTFNGYVIDSSVGTSTPFADPGFSAALMAKVSDKINNVNMIINSTAPGSEVDMTIINGYLPITDGGWQQFFSPTAGTFTFTTTL